MIVIKLTVEDTLSGASAQADIPSEFGPALRSALEDLSNILGERLVGVHKFEREDSITFAVTALGPLRAAVNQVVPQGDPNYEV
jgi:hypothetical protein